MSISAIGAMPLRDFFGYWAHSLRYMTPTQRHEHYLAQLTHVVAVTMGSYKGSMQDFLLFADTPKDEAKSSRKRKKSKQEISDIAFKNFNQVNKKAK